MIDEEGTGHANSKALAAVLNEGLAELGLSRNAQDILDTGKFMIPQNQKFEANLMNCFR